MREGSLEAPTRHVLDWQNPEFSDREKTEAEMERVFDICHTCRRCFNLCDSFPRLFDLIDNSSTGELDAVPKTDYKQVADACTLCDMCFMTKCPYVPPHEFNIDFPHLMLRYRAVEAREGRVPFAQRELTRTDRNGKIAGKIAPLANWASDRHNTLTRPIMEKVAGVDRNAALPQYQVRPIRQVAEAEGALLGRIRLLIVSMVLLILILTALCVLGTMAALAMERRKDVGLMKSLGGSISRIVGIFLAEVGVLGAAGGLLGTILGAALSYWMGLRVFGTAIAPRWEVFPVTVALMILVTLAGALPLRMLGNVKPAEILRGA